MVNKLVGALLLTASFSLCTGHAAVLTWGAATTVTGDSDVSTNGTLVGAVNLTGGAVPPPTKTVNGVSFASWDASVSPSVSGIFSAPPSGFGSYLFFTNAAPFGGLSTDYKDLLRDGGHTPNGTTLTISGLTSGQTYLIQWWSTVPDPANSIYNAPSTASAGNNATLDPNVTNLAGGLGQYAIGSFTADSATQLLAFGAGSTISAIQVRRTSTSNVPDGGTTLALFGLALASLVEVRRRLRR